MAYAIGEREPRRRTATAGPVVATTLLIAAACSTPAPEAPTFEEASATLADCPEGDAPWRPALAAAQAEQRLEELLELADRCAGSREDRWEGEWAAGECLLRLGRAGEAQPRYARGLELARAAADDVGVSCTANRTAVMAFYAGQLKRGRDDYEEALAAALRAERDDLAAYVRNNLAGLLVETGEFPQARRELALAEVGLAGLGLAAQARAAAFNQGMIQLALGDANGALRTLKRVTGEAEQAGDRRTLDNAAVALGNLHRYRREWDEALRWYESVSDASDQLAVRAVLGRGRVALERGEYDRAAELLASAVELAGDSMGLLGTYAQVFQADAAARAGRVAAARGLLEEAIAASAADESRDTEWAAHWTLGRLELREGNVAAAEGHLARAVEVLDAQSAPLNPLGQGLHFLRLRADPYVDLAAAVVGGGGDDVAGQVLDIAGRAQARALRQALHGASTTPPAAELSALRSGLADGELLVDYLVGEERGILLAVTRETSRVHTIPGSAELRSDLGRYRTWLRDPGSGALDPATRDAGRRLRAALLGPVADLLGAAARLYVVPDRELALLPFDALPGTAGDGYLGDSVDVAFMPLAAPPPRLDGARAPLLIGGQPVLAPDSGFADLPWAAFELSRLSEVWGERGARLVTGSDLTLAGLRAAGLERAATLHLTTHAVASTRDPQRCGVILSGERLDIDAILELSLPSSLVVLSACRTGEGELLPGEGVVGLGWAFLRAGAGAIVVSRWTVDDAASARLMVAFHEGLRDGVDPVHALAGARRELAARKEHPAYWAPFVIVLSPGQARASVQGRSGPES
jgi:CHAT domain-containing protein/tetratricopeptide (TPR) repeat protein